MDISSSLVLDHVAVFGELAQWKSVLEYDEDEEYYDEYDPELYEDEGVMSAGDLDPVAFCDECAPEDGDFLPLPNSPREGIDCYDNVHSWQAWPLPDYGER